MAKTIETMKATADLRFPPKFASLFKPAPYKVFYGGRGSGKSWSIARALLIEATQRKMRVLCAREFQTTMKDSVKKLLADQIEEIGLTPWFAVQRDTILSSVGSEFLFKGLRVDPQGVRSIEGIDRCWIEEAQVVSEESWQVLMPTLFRKERCELWISFNPDQDTDPTYKNFVLQPPPKSIVQKVGWEDNPWFPEGLNDQRRHMLNVDPDAYEWIWGGHCRQISEAVIFRNRVSVETFDTPEGARFFFGADWGFADDPAVLIRCWIKDDCLFIDHEAFGYHVELDNLSAVFDQIPESRRWPIKGDSAQPMQISYMKRQGFNITPADKWPGSVEDGINHLKAFKRIVVHERCKNVAQEFRLYSYKTDRLTGDILPVIVDKHNHGIDSLRYALSQFIQGRRPMKISPDLLQRASSPGAFARSGR